MFIVSCAFVVEDANTKICLPPTKSGILLMIMRNKDELMPAGNIEIQRKSYLYTAAVDRNYFSVQLKQYSVQ